MVVSLFSGRPTTHLRAVLREEMYNQAANNWRKRMIPIEKIQTLPCFNRDTVFSIQ